MLSAIHYFKAHFTHIMENVVSRVRYDSGQNSECGVMAPGDETELVQTRDDDGGPMLGKQRIWANNGKKGGVRGANG